METTKLYFECENCGQPFDIEISSGDFECIKECIYEFKSEFHCCGKNIEIKINVKRYSAEEHSRHEIYYKGLRNLRIGGNFDNIINEVCDREFQEIEIL